MTYYTIRPVLPDGSLGWLAPIGNGGYVVTDSALGAAGWKTYEEALSVARLLGIEAKVRKLL